MDVEYDIKKQAGGLLELDSVSTVCIEAFTSDGKECYLIVRTMFGRSYILEYGPIIPDLNIMNEIKECSLTCTIYQTQYEQNKLLKIIYNFLNKPTYKIISAQVVDEEVINRIIPLKDVYMNTLMKGPSD